MRKYCYSLKKVLHLLQENVILKSVVLAKESKFLDEGKCDLCEQSQALSIGNIPYIKGKKKQSFYGTKQRYGMMER